MSKECLNSKKALVVIFFIFVSMAYSIIFLSGKIYDLSNYEVNKSYVHNDFGSYLKNVDILSGPFTFAIFSIFVGLMSKIGFPPLLFNWLLLLLGIYYLTKIMPVSRRALIIILSPLVSIYYTQVITKEIILICGLMSFYYSVKSHDRFVFFLSLVLIGMTRYFLLFPIIVAFVATFISRKKYQMIFFCLIFTVTGLLIPKFFSGHIQITENYLATLPPKTFSLSRLYLETLNVPGAVVAWFPLRFFMNLIEPLVSVVKGKFQWRDLSWYFEIIFSTKMLILISFFFLTKSYKKIILNDYGNQYLYNVIIYMGVSIVISPYVHMRYLVPWFIFAYITYIGSVKQACLVSSRK